ncbi:MAG: acetate--CoA ligase [Desulfobacteraceae bacterium]
MQESHKWYDAHLEEYRKIAYIRGREEYESLYKRSIEDPEGFWAEQAEKYLSWEKTWDFVLRYDLEKPEIEWFGGARLNASYNCLDRHLAEFKDKTAYYWEGDDPGETRVVTYGELYDQVNKTAALLQSKGVKKGDRVVIYMPMLVELPVAMLACARIGAVHSVVFGGFSAEALANRINDCGAKVLLTADGGFRAGKAVPLKNNVDEALKSCPEVDTVVVFDRTGLEASLDPDREVWWHDAIGDPSLPDYVEPEPMDAEDPLFILYTSGSTGKPKGVVHTHAGYLLYAAMTTRIVFDMKDDEVFWCTADIGWVTGHTYGVYGPLANGFTSVLFEGVPSYPDFDRYWAVVERYKVAKFYTAPTVIRALAREGHEHVEKHDISSLMLLGSVGEPINPEAWRWYYHYVGRDWCPIMDTWWQTETGGHMLTPLPGVAPIKPGSCSFPFFGVDPVILDDVGKEVKYPDQEGVLCIRKPWPGMARTVFGDHERFKETYFSQIPGMYFTGDGAKRDEDGYFWIIGRIDDVINVSGHRLGTAEIESALVLHDKVAEAAVVGFPHPVKGQGIYAFVTLMSGAAGSDELKKELIGLVRSEIGPIATIDVIQWAEALPKTRSGKIMRRILQKIAAGLTDEIGDTSTIADPSVVERLIRERSEV